MKIEKGTMLRVSHSRKGNFTGQAMEDFDTDKTEFFPIRIAQVKSVKGMVNEWDLGEAIPCRNSLCEIKVL